MKNILIWAVFLFFCFAMNAQYDMKLILKDGTELVGESWSKGKEYVMFKPSPKGKKIKYKRELVYSREGIDYKTREKEVFYYKKIKGKKEIRSLKKHIPGKVEIFLMPIRLNHANGGSSYFEDYCIGKPEDDFVVKFNYGPKFKKFQKIIDYYFSDCPEIVPKINNLEFGDSADAIEGIIKYYNEKCTTNP